MTQIIILIFLMAGSVLGCAVWKKRFEELLPVTCSGIVLVLFLCGFLGILNLGVFLVAVSCIILWLISAVWLFKTKEWKAFIQSFFTPGFCVFIVLYFLLGTLSRDMMATEWDEFSHWADIVKVMVNIDDFGTNPQSGSLFASYPPGMALFQYFFQEIYLLVKPQELFSEWRMYFSYQIFFISFLVPFLKQLSFKEPLKIVLMGITIWIGPMLIFTNVYSSIYVDAMLGFIAGAGAAAVFVQKEKDWLYDVYIWLSIAMLILAKDAGMLFAAFLLLLYIGDILCCRNQKKDNFFIQKINLVRIIIGVCALLIPKYLWSLDIRINEASVAFGNKVDAAELIRIILGREPENYRSSVLKLFSIAFMSHKVEIGELTVEIPYIALLIIFAGIGYWFYYKYKELEPENSTLRKIVVWALVILSVLFVAGTCVSYMYKFSEGEALGLAGFTRYMKIIFHCWWIFLLLVAVHYAVRGNEKKIRAEIFVFCIVMAVLPWADISLNVTRQRVDNAVAARASYQVLIDQIEEVTKDDSEPSSITVICQETQGYEQLLFRYALRPHGVDWNYSIGEPFYEGDTYTETITAEDWQARLVSKRDYVALYKINDYFVENFSTLFENPEDIHENGLYRVNKETRLLELCETAME